MFNFYELNVSFEKCFNSLKESFGRVGENTCLAIANIVKIFVWKNMRKCSSNFWWWHLLRVIKGGVYGKTIPVLMFFHSSQTASYTVFSSEYIDDILWGFNYYFWTEKRFCVFRIEISHGNAKASLFLSSLFKIIINKTTFFYIVHSHCSLDGATCYSECRWKIYEEATQLQVVIQHLFNRFRSSCSFRKWHCIFSTASGPHAASGNDTALFVSFQWWKKKFSPFSGRHTISLNNQLIYRTADQGTVPFHMFSSDPEVNRYIRYLSTVLTNVIKRPWMFRIFIFSEFSIFCLVKQCTNVVKSCEIRNFMTRNVSNLQPLRAKSQGKPQGADPPPPFFWATRRQVEIIEQVKYPPPLH